MTSNILSSLPLLFVCFHLYISIHRMPSNLLCLSNSIPFCSPNSLCYQLRTPLTRRTNNGLNLFSNSNLNLFPINSFYYLWPLIISFFLPFFLLCFPSLSYILLLSILPITFSLISSSLIQTYLYLLSIHRSISNTFPFFILYSILFNIFKKKTIYILFLHSSLVPIYHLILSIIKIVFAPFFLSTMIDIQLMNHFYSSSSFLTLLKTSNCPSTILKEKSIPSTIFAHQDHESISVLNALIYLYIHYSNDEFYFNTTLLSLSILMKSLSSSISIVFFFSPFSSYRIQLFLYSLSSYAYNLCLL